MYEIQITGIAITFSQHNYIHKSLYATTCELANVILIYKTLKFLIYLYKSP